MQDLIVVAYRNEYSAVDNMQTLRRLNAAWVVAVHDAVAVARDADGKLHIQDSYKPTTGEGAGWGVLLGSILGGLALAPFTGGLSTAVAAGAVVGGAAGAAVAYRQTADIGLPEDLVAELSATVPDGGSAVFALVEIHDPDQVAEYFRGTGGKIIRTNLSPYQQARIQQIVDGGD